MFHFDQLFTSGVHLCETIKTSLNFDENDEILLLVEEAIIIFGLKN